MNPTKTITTEDGLFRIERLAAFFGRTTERVEWRVIRIADERNIGTYSTKREALEWAAIYAK